MDEGEEGEEEEEGEEGVESEEGVEEPRRETAPIHNRRRACEAARRPAMIGLWRGRGLLDTGGFFLGYRRVATMARRVEWERERV